LEKNLKKKKKNKIEEIKFETVKRNFETVEALYGTENSLPKKKPLLELIAKTVLEALQTIISNPPSLSYIIALACKNESNAFGFYYPYGDKSQILDSSTEAHLYAFGLYPMCSLYNHSCMPNTFRVNYGKILQFKALEDISEGEEVTHSYMQFEIINTNQRQTELHTNYGFWCHCPCCQDEEIKEKFLEERVCPRFGCGGLLITEENERYCIK